MTGQIHRRATRDIEVPQRHDSTAYRQGSKRRRVGWTRIFKRLYQVRPEPRGSIVVLVINEFGVLRKRQTSEDLDRGGPTGDSLARSGRRHTMLGDQDTDYVAR